MREKHIIDTHKGITGLVVLGLIAWQNAWREPAALVYLAIHGSYGLMWVLKSRHFPDKSWEKPCSLQRAVAIWAALSLYWIAPWILITSNPQASAWIIALSVFLFGIGIFLHFCSDMQKHVALKLRPGHLIHTGLWGRLRNPNYFGELLIYVSFAILAMHWLPFIVLAMFIAAYWLPNMLRKDRSLARYPGFAAYRARSWLFVPFLI